MKKKYTVIQLLISSGIRAFCWWRTCVSQTIRLSNYSTETKLLSLTNPIHSQIQFTHREFVKKTKLYFEAVELNDEKKQRFALLFNLNEDAFRLAESVEFVKGVDAYKNWIKKFKSLLKRNQTSTEKRYNFHRREQEPLMLCRWTFHLFFH